MNTDSRPRRSSTKDGRSNVLQIGLDGTRFEMDPCLPSVKVGFEPLIVGVNWAKNRGTWQRVVLKEFAFSDGTPCEVDPPEIAFEDGDVGERKLEFRFTVAADTEIKFTVELQQITPSQVIAIDPVIFGKPGP